MATLLEEHWGSRQVISRGILHDAALLPGSIAEWDSKMSGMITLHLPRPGNSNLFPLVSEAGMPIRDEIEVETLLEVR